MFIYSLILGVLCPEKIILQNDCVCISCLQKEVQKHEGDQRVNHSAPQTLKIDASTSNFTNPICYYSSNRAYAISPYSSFCNFYTPCTIIASFERGSMWSTFELVQKTIAVGRQNSTLSSSAATPDSL